MNCINHPIQASAACANCGAPICSSCTMIARGNNVCPTCAPQVRQNGIAPPVSAMAVAAMPTANAAAVSPYPDFSGGGQATVASPAPSEAVDLQGQPIPSQSMPTSPSGSPQSPPLPSIPAGQPHYAAPPGPPRYMGPDTSAAALAKARQEDKANLIKGIIVGSIIGLAGSILTMEILFFARMMVAYGYILVGYGIGAGVWHFTNRGGTQLGIVSVCIMVGSLAVAHLIYAAQELSSAVAAGNVPPGTNVFDVLPDIAAAFSPMHWVCILIGVAACWGAAQRQPA